MLKILVPIDASRNADHALKQDVNVFKNNPDMEIHLLNFQPPFSRHIAQFIGRKTRHSFHRDEAKKVLRPAKQFIERFGVPCLAHFAVGRKATTIVDTAHSLRCNRIVTSAARKNSLARMLKDSTTNKVLEQTRVPVEIIAG